MKARLNRRIVHGALAVGIVLAAAYVLVVGPHGRARAAGGMERPQLLRSIRSQTYAYKTVGDLQIKADVHRFDDDVDRPVVVWIHGGALIMGNRGGLFGISEMMLEAGYVVVSIDYRLAPETHLPSIVDDLEDALAWVRTMGRELFNADTSKIAVMGGSAGWYLTLTSGFCAEHRPTVLVSFWGYGDLVGDWYSQPSEHARHNRRNISAAEAYAQVGGPPISDARDRAGNGGMGQVWQATDTLLNCEVALKILPDAFAADSDWLARFTREAQILASLNHPNIAAIHGIEEAEGTRALVLELVEGPTLADRIKQWPIPADEARG